MNKKALSIIRIFLIFMIVISILLVLPNKSTAITDVVENPNSWKPKDGGEGEGKLSEKVGPILGILNIIGVIASVGTLMVIGIKIMLGSVEERAKYKQILIPWLIGAIMVFSVTTIPNLIYKTTRSITADQVEVHKPGKPDIPGPTPEIM